MSVRKPGRELPDFSLADLCDGPCCATCPTCHKKGYHSWHCPKWDDGPSVAEDLKKETQDD
jgi:hypothetical protein